MRVEPWLEELLDLGVGALAVKHLYRMRRGIAKPVVCPYCGYVFGKWGVRCPKCRRVLG